MGVQVLGPAVAARQRRLAAVMFTDMVGFSALTQADEAGALAVLERHNKILRSAFARYRGHEVKTVGDAFLVEFGSALEAVECAVEVQRALHDYNASADAPWKIRIRIGIHLGDVVETSDDVLGDAVNIASRVHALADAGGICFTQQVFDQVGRKSTVKAERLPPVTLKNIQQAVTIYRVSPNWERPTGRGPERERREGRSMAVLPLSNISPNPQDDYFADGLTEELISVLSQVPGLSVIARTSIVQYKATTKPIAQIGAELGVDVILEGSVRKSGDRIRVSLQLIDVPTQRHLWTDTYSRDVGDVFGVQTEVAERTARALELRLSRESAPAGARVPTANAAAYDLYLRGLVASNHETLRFDAAIRYFEQATTLDPSFADAFAAWANLYVIVAGDEKPMREMMPEARRLASRAIELDPESSAAHASLGNIAFQFDHDWTRAESEFRRAIALNPSNTVALRFFTLMLGALGRFEEALVFAREAVRIDPIGTNGFMLAWAELAAGNPAAGATYAESERDRTPDSVGAHIALGLFYVAAGRRQDALREADRPLGKATPLQRFDHAFLMATLGRPEEAREVLREIDGRSFDLYTTGADLALLYVALGEKGKALDLLEEDLQHGDGMAWMYSLSPWFDSLRKEPRYVALLKLYGLPTEDRLHPWPVVG